MVRIFQPEKSVRAGGATYSSRARLIPLFRWRRGPLPCSPVRIAMKSTMSHGIPLIQSFSALRARRTEGSCSGTQGVRLPCLLCLACDSLSYDQKAGTSNSAHSRYPRSRSTMLQTANPCFMYHLATSSSSCRTGRILMTLWPKHDGLRWTALPYVFSFLFSHEFFLNICASTADCVCRHVQSHGS
jgi:hypothetical protein